MRQSELVEDFKQSLDLFLRRYTETLDIDDKMRYNRLIEPHVENMLVNIEERIENILEDELLSDAFEGE